MLKFKNKILGYIKNIPKSRVASYGQAAAMSGKPRAARALGWILRRIDASDKAIPWWRVVNNKGVISIKGNWTVSKDLQAKLLQKEGVEVKKDFTLDIQKYRFKY